MQTERRSAPRQGLNSLVYLDLEPDNGGILLNLSESGMQISVANRLMTSGEVRFTLCLQATEVIRGTGRIAWLSPSGRSAGVHFLSLPESARAEIRQWLGVSADSSSTEEAHDITEPAPETQQAAPPVLHTESPAFAEPEPETPQTKVPAYSSAEASEIQVAAASGVQTQAVPETTSPAPEVSAPPLEPVEAPAPPEPAPVDALELLGSAVETPPMETAPPAWAPAAVAPPAPAFTDGAEAPSSVLSLYGIDGREEIQPSSPPPQPADEESERPRNFDAERWNRRAKARRRKAARRALQHASRVESERRDLLILDDASGIPASHMSAGQEKTARRHPPILLSPIFIPAPPPSAALPPPEVTYTPVSSAMKTIETLPVEQPQRLPSPEPPAAETQLTPGALYLPNYRLEGVSQDGTRWQFTKRVLASPGMAVHEIFTRFEEFGWSLESDWHVWLGLILMVAGFLALAQRPPLIVLTIAFWFASAVFLMDRRRPRHGARRPQNAGRH
jgi:hypothetical protein